MRWILLLLALLAACTPAPAAQTIHETLDLPGDQPAFLFFFTDN